MGSPEHWPDRLKRPAIIEEGVMTTAIAQDLWRSQRDALQDLTAFIDEHGPGAGQPLPLLHWRVGPSRTVRAEVHSLDREHGGGHRDPRAVLVAYSKALDAKIVEHPDAERVLLVADGRIGPPEDGETTGRTHVVISARVPREDRRKTGGRAFLP